MRILVVADIHGNRAALEAVSAVPHDAAICVGDLVAFGPDPHACVQWTQANASVAVQGNHDWVAADPFDRRDAGGIEPFQSWAPATESFTRSDLDASDRAYLAALPRWAVLDLSGRRYLVVHATPTNPLYGVVPPDVDAWRRELDGVEADVVVVGHTHHQFALAVGRTMVVNPGSVGFPLDGDARAAYAIIEDREIHLEHVDYRATDTLRGLRKRGIAPEAITGIASVLLTGTLAHAEGMGQAIHSDPAVAP